MNHLLHVLNLLSLPYPPDHCDRARLTDCLPSYFQCGVSNFLLTRYDVAFNDFSSALLYLRGNQFINYEQLGLKFKLFSAEVLFNRGLTQIYMGNAQEGLADMEDARREKATEEHGVIDDAIQDRGEGYTVFSIVSLLFPRISHLALVAKMAAT